jgi:hypothetical protein
MTRERDPLPDPLMMQTPELLTALKRYRFTDPEGHPLGNCVEFKEIVRRAALPAAGDAAAKGRNVQPTDAPTAKDLRLAKLVAIPLEPAASTVPCANPAGQTPACAQCVPALADGSVRPNTEIV